MGRVAARAVPVGLELSGYPTRESGGGGKILSWHGTEFRTAAKKRSRSRSGKKRRRWRMRASEEAAALPHQLWDLSQEAGGLGSRCSSTLWHESPPPTQVRKDRGFSQPCASCGPIRWLEGTHKGGAFYCFPCWIPQVGEEVLWAPAGHAPQG